MMKWLGDRLDNLIDFSYDHPAFSMTFVGVVLFALIIGLAFFLPSLENHGTEVKWEGQITLRDTRRVYCVVTDEGMSCDWPHADGSDNL